MNSRPAPEPRGVPGRDTCLHRLLEKLGTTSLSDAFGLGRIRSLDDFRHTIPIHDAREHATAVEDRLGFGVVELDDADADHWIGGAVERPAVVDRWRLLDPDTPQIGAVLRRPADEPVLDRILDDDLEALMGTKPKRLADLGREDILSELVRLGPHVLVVPSRATIGWLEAATRAPLERTLTSLRTILAEHDLDERTRCRVPTASTGWIHGAGRIGIPDPFPRTGALTFAMASCLIELLPHEDPVQRQYATGASTTILPEEAVVGGLYEVIVSSTIGYLRLRTQEHVRVVGFAQPTASLPVPRPRFVRIAAPPPSVPLEGTRLSGAWIGAAIRQAFTPEDPALVAAEVSGDPDSVDADMRATSMRLNRDPFTETELGTRSDLRKRRKKRPRALVVRVEIQGQAATTLAAALADRIDADLCRRSPPYAYLRERNDLYAPRVLVASGGTARAGLERRLASLEGSVGVPQILVRPRLL